MAEAAVAGAYIVETAVEGAAGAAYAVAKATLPLRARWQQFGADSPLARSSHSMVVIAGKAYVFGGEEQPGKLADNAVHVYTLPQGIAAGTDYVAVGGNESSGTTATPPARIGHTAVAVGQWMYVFGGRGGGDGNAAPLDEAGRVWSFDTKTNAWEAIDPCDDNGPKPEPRSDHASAATEHPLPAKTAVERDAPAALAQRHGTIFMHGGVTDASGRLSSDLWAFDIAARTWKRLPDAPGPPRSGAALACTSKRLYRFGGFDGEAHVGGQIDVLELGKETFVDQAGVAEASVIASPKKNDGQWTSVRNEEGKDATLFPGSRSAAGLHHVTTGQGRSYLILILGEKTPGGTGVGSSFWDDVWAFQLKPDGMSGASFKDAIRMTVGAKTREYTWAPVQVPEATKTEGLAGGPGARGRFASADTRDMDGSAIVMWGGVNGGKESLGDGYILHIEAA